MKKPIFGGVVLSSWQSMDAHAVEVKLDAFKAAGIDYIRLECNLGTVDEIGGPEQLADDPRFSRLAEVARICQTHEMVPLILLQVPWRESGDTASRYFKQAVHAFAEALRRAQVAPRRVLFETRPPMALTAQEERGHSLAQRQLNAAQNDEYLQNLFKKFAEDGDDGIRVIKKDKAY